MARRTACVCPLALLFLLLGTRASSAEKLAPEALLPADAVVYLHLHSWKEAQPAYNQTVLGELLRGDLGTFIGGLGDLVRKNHQSIQEQVPSRLVTKANLTELNQAWQHMVQRGMHLALSWRGGEVFSGQVMAVFPDEAAAGKPGPIQRVWENEAIDDTTVKKVKKAGLTISLIEEKGVGSIAWWAQGGHLVAVLSTEPSAKLIDRVLEKKAGNLTTNALFQKPEKSPYPTILSGFVDCHRLAKALLPGKADGAVKAGWKALGLEDLQGLSFRFGFEGKAWRESWALHLDARRHGLWKLLGTARGLDVRHLPVLPPDTTHVWVGSADLAGLGKALSPLLPLVNQQSAAGEEEKRFSIPAEPAVKKFLAAVGPQVLWFNSPSEGGWLLDQGFAVQVKDAAALNKFCRRLQSDASLRKRLGWEGTLRNQSYRGVQYWTLVEDKKGGEESSVSLPASFVIHEGWLVFGLNTQIVQGYILRAKEKVPGWQPATELAGAMARRPAGERVIGISHQNARAVAKFWLSFLPWLGLAIDPATIPNAHALTAPLFPNTTLLIDDGQALRWESYSSLPLPPSLTSMVLACAAVQTYAKLLPVPNWFPQGLGTCSAPHNPVASGVCTPSFPAACKPEKGLEKKTFNSTPPEVYRMTRRKFYLPVQIEERGRDQLKEVRLYVKTGNAEWQIQETAHPTVTYFAFQAPHDGKYCFAVATVDKNGHMTPPDISKEEPGLCVVVDSQSPTTPTTARVKKIPPAGKGAGPFDCPPAEPSLVPASTVKAIQVVKVYDLTGLLDPADLDKSKAELLEAFSLVTDANEKGTAPKAVFFTHKQRLVVRASAVMHEDIGRLLEKLRKGDGKRQKGAKP